MTTSASLQARGLTLSLGLSPILNQVDLSVVPGWKIGLVGPNGVGKSTLLKVLSGQMPVDSGTVQTTPLDANVGYLPQEPERRADELVEQFLSRRTGVTGANADLDAATADLAIGVPDADDRYSTGCERY